MTSKPRRDYGEGAIYQRESDGRWVSSLRVNGKRKYYYGKTRDEVKQKLKKAQREQEQGILATGPKQTVQQFLEYWLTVKKPTVKESTGASHEWYVRQVFGELGHVKLEKLTADMIQACYNTLQERLSSNTVRELHVILSSSLKDAVKWKRMTYNPCKDVKPPRAEKHDIQFLTPEQVKDLLQSAQGTALECLLTVAVTIGLRRGELLALRWSDINLERGSLHVRHTVSYVRVAGAGFRYVETDPKTATSSRHITLPKIVVDALKAHKARQVEQRWQAGSKWHENGLIFCDNEGGYYHIPALYKQFMSILKRAGLPHMRFHDCRHTAATVLLIRGVNPKVVSEMLGHSSVVVTLNTYSHVIPTLQKSAMDELDMLYTVAN